MSTLVVFEDAACRAFEIVAALRGVFDLRCGGRTLLERLQADCGASRLVLVARPGLHDLLGETHPEAAVGAAALDSVTGDVLFANGRLLSLGNDVARLFAAPGAFVRMHEAALVAARCDAPLAGRLAAHLEASLEPAVEPVRAWMAREWPDAPLLRVVASNDGSVLLEHTWDLVRHNGSAIIDDFRRGPGAGIAPGALVYPGVHLLQDGAIRIGPGCRVKPGVVIDAEDGPVTLEAEVVVQPNVVVRGPVHVGRGSVLKAGAKVHEGTSLGPVCKIGGEVEECVVQGFSNKQHEGFLGHAYLGEWVNLGADTNNSDLKNNYATVRVWEAGRAVDTGLLFVGLLAADHVKSAIDTAFNTGTVVGLASQIFGAGFPPKFVAPFSWGGAARLDLYEFERALATARTVMQRRGRTLGPAYAQVFERVFEAWRDAPRSAALS